MSNTVIFIGHVITRYQIGMAELLRKTWSYICLVEDAQVAHGSQSFIRCQPDIWRVSGGGRSRLRLNGKPDPLPVEREIPGGVVKWGAGMVGGLERYLLNLQLDAQT